MRAYSLSELIEHTGASRSEAINLVQTKTIAPDVSDTTGTGTPRAFGFRDGLEMAVAAALNRLPGGFPTRALALALDPLREGWEPIPRARQATRARALAVIEELRRTGADRARYWGEIVTDSVGDHFFLDAVLLTTRPPEMIAQPGPPKPDVQSWSAYLDPRTRDHDARFFLAWSPRLSLGLLIDNQKVLHSAQHLDVLVLVNLNTILLDLEARTGDAWSATDQHRLTKRRVEQH